MKKSVVILSCAILISFCSCSNEEVRDDGTNSTDVLVATESSDASEAVESSELVPTTVVEDTQLTDSSGSSSFNRDEQTIEEAWNARLAVSYESVDTDLVSIDETSGDIVVSDALPNLKSSVDAIVSENDSYYADSIITDDIYYITRFDGCVLSFYHFGLNGDSKKPTYKCYNYTLDGEQLEFSDVVLDVDRFCEIVKENNVYNQIDRTYNTDNWVMTADSFLLMDPESGKGRYPNSVPYKYFADFIIPEYLPNGTDILASMGYGVYCFGDNEIEVSLENYSATVVRYNGEKIDYISDLKQHELMGEDKPEFVEIYLLKVDSTVLLNVYQYSPYDGNLNSWITYDLSNGTASVKDCGEGFSSIK